MNYLAEMNEKQIETFRRAKRNVKNSRRQVKFDCMVGDRARIYIVQQNRQFDVWYINADGTASK